MKISENKLKKILEKYPKQRKGEIRRKKELCIFCGKNKMNSATFCACYECLGVAGLEANNQKCLETIEENLEKLEKREDEWS